MGIAGSVNGNSKDFCPSDSVLFLSALKAKHQVSCQNLGYGVLDGRVQQFCFA